MAKNGMVSARDIVGKRITGFNPNPVPFPTRQGHVIHRPTIELDDGSWLYFVVEETDLTEYGVVVGRQVRRRTRPHDESPSH